MNAVERLRAVTARFALEYVSGPEPLWVGRAEGVPIRISAVPGRAGARLRFELPLPERRGSLFVIAAAHVLAFDDGSHTGDASFDEHTFVRSDDTSTLGCFDAPTRVLAAELTTLGAFVAGGALRLDGEALSEAQLGTIDEIVQRLVSFSRRLHIDQAQANHEMVRIARSDPDPQVRATFNHYLTSTSQLRDADGLERVRAEHDDEQATLERLTAQLHNPGSGRTVRLEAGTRLLALFPLARIERVLSLAGPDLAAPMIERIAQIMARSGGAPETLQVGARLILGFATRVSKLDDATLEELLGALALAPLPTSFDLLVSLCERKSIAVVLAALVVLHKLDKPVGEIMRKLSPAASAQLRELLPTFSRNHPELGARLLIEFFERIEPRYVSPRIAYLRAIGATRDVSVGPRLVKEIDSPYEEVQLAVVEALQHVGDLSAVPALKPLTEGLFRSGQLKAAARAAIELIRAREGARSLPGALSIADGAEAGGLSVSDEAPDDPT